MSALSDSPQIICTKCSTSKDDNLAPTCHCGGSYKPSLNRNEMKGRLRVLQGIIEYHELSMTGEYVSSILDRW